MGPCAKIAAGFSPSRGRLAAVCGLVRLRVSCVRQSTAAMCGLVWIRASCPRRATAALCTPVSTVRIETGGSAQAVQACGAGGIKCVCRPNIRASRANRVCVRCSTRAIQAYGGGTSGPSIQQRRARPQDRVVRVVGTLDGRARTACKRLDTVGIRHIHGQTERRRPAGGADAALKAAADCDAALRTLQARSADAGSDSQKHGPGIGGTRLRRGFPTYARAPLLHQQSESPGRETTRSAKRGRGWRCKARPPRTGAMANGLHSKR